MARKSRNQKAPKSKLQSSKLFMGIVALAVLLIVLALVFGRPAKMMEPEQPIMEEEMPPAVETPPPEVGGEITVREPQLQINSLVVQPTNPKVGDTVNFRISVKNAGPVTSEATTVIVVVDGQELSTELRSLTQGEAQSLTISWQPTEAGDYFASAEVVPDSREIIMEDNFDTAEFIVT